MEPTRNRSRTRAPGSEVSRAPEISFSVIGPVALRPCLALRYSLRPESRTRAAELLRERSDEEPSGTIL